MKHRIAIFASGGGSNARSIMQYFKDSEDIAVALVVSNKSDAGVLGIAEEFGVPSRVINRAEFQDQPAFLALLAAHHIDFIALAGFLWLIPPYLVAAFRDRIVNIHPSLLPKFGGKGMHGLHVHEAVKAAGENESGMTVHFVNEHYDEGAVIFQARCPVAPEDSPADIARNVLVLEHRHYARVIEELLKKQ